MNTAHLSNEWGAVGLGLVGGVLTELDQIWLFGKCFKCWCLETVGWLTPLPSLLPPTPLCAIMLLLVIFTTVWKEEGVPFHLLLFKTTGTKFFFFFKF